jgi:hypothetical protein
MAGHLGLESRFRASNGALSEPPKCLKHAGEGASRRALIDDPLQDRPVPTRGVDSHPTPCYKILSSPKRSLDT